MPSLAPGRLKVRYNAYPVLAERGRTARVGLGLYPAAAYINHRCDPNVTCAAPRLPRPRPRSSCFAAAQTLMPPRERQ